ncbi:MAG: methionine--tRNA ligase [Desulfobacterales bacterium]|nr:methionine--tRNA ligase [Desulfobacterales bacterium]
MSNHELENYFYITTPIYYVNAKPHIGHAYTTLTADVIRRYHQMLGEKTFFLTGTDEHGDKIVDAAKKENMGIREYVNTLSNMFKSLWPELNIHPDYFVRTTDKAHIEVVEGILKKIYDQGDIYYSEYEGLYCFGCERFYMERELVDGKCPDHNRKPEPIKEANYFFRMSRYQEWLIDHIQTHADFIQPKHYANEVLSFLKEPLEDLCISRPKTRLKWGITLPFDANYVTYVWFDALLNYISALGYPDGVYFKTFWPVSEHIIAKDILKPHAIYWPIMLKAAGIDIYKRIHVHGFWNINKSKMSKTLGNVISPMELKEKYGVEAIRYFMMREMAFGLDSDFAEDAIVQRINSDLANDLGNLFSRVLAMTHKFFGGKIPEPDPEAEIEFHLGLTQQAMNTIEIVEQSMEQFQFHRALSAIWDFINHMNKYVDTTSPWVLAKNKTSKRQLETVMYNLLEGLRIISGLIYPVMPKTSKLMQDHLAIDSTEKIHTISWLKSWKMLQTGKKLPKTITLFPRIDVTKLSGQPYPIEEAQQSQTTKPEITFDEFQKMDLRVATVLDAERVPNTQKLLKVTLNMGETRTVVAGIAESYSPSDLIGKQVIVLANLTPVKLRGIVSNGMILAGTNQGKHSIATVEKPIQPGTPLK